MLLIPIRNNDLAVKRLPIVTIGILTTCILIFGFTVTRLSDEEQKISNQYEQLVELYLAHPYLELSSHFVSQRSKNFQHIYQTQRKWFHLYKKNKSAAASYIKESKVPTNPPTAKGDIETFLNVMSPTESPSAAPFTAETQLSESRKIQFITQLSRLSASQYDVLQNQLDEQLDAYERTKDAAITTRFGYTPHTPSIVGLATYQFVHRGFFHILMNLFLLWLIAPQLEDLWGRVLFLGIYLGCGSIGAIVHHITHWDSATPIIGASGSIAGLMGAFAFRYANTKLKFFYAYFALRLTPKTGTFEAPAYFMIFLWFLGQLFYGFWADNGSVAYWAHIGGFIAGLGLAIIFKVTNFETNVLGHKVQAIGSNKTESLIAFTSLSNPNAHTLSTAQRPAREILLEKITDDGILFRSHGQTNSIVFDDLRAIAPARIDRIAAADAGTIFGLGIPTEPAYLLALIPVNESTLPNFVYILNAANCRWASVYPKPMNGAVLNMIQLTKMALKKNVLIKYIHGEGPVGVHNLPIYDSLNGFLRHLHKHIF